MAFGLDTRSDLNKASTPWSKYRTMIKVRPKDHSVAFGLDTHLEMGKASTALSNYRRASTETMMAVALTAEPSVVEAALTATVRVTALTVEPMELDSISIDLTWRWARHTRAFGLSDKTKEGKAEKAAVDNAKAGRMV